MTPAARRAAIVQAYHDSANRCRDRWETELRDAAASLRDATRRTGDPAAAPLEPGRPAGPVTPAAVRRGAVTGILSR